MANPLQKARMIQLKGLGYERSEIADKVGLTPNQVKYWTYKMEQQARENGPDETYIQLMADGLTPEILKTIKLIQKLK